MAKTMWCRQRRDVFYLTLTLQGRTERLAMVHFREDTRSIDVDA
jgi:hypothetical protein